MSEKGPASNTRAQAAKNDSGNGTENTNEGVGPSRREAEANASETQARDANTEEASESDMSLEEDDAAARPAEARHAMRHVIQMPAYVA